MEWTEAELNTYITKGHALAVIEAHGHIVCVPKGTVVLGVPLDRDMPTECYEDFFRNCWTEHMALVGSNHVIKAYHLMGWLRGSLNSPWRNRVTE